MSESEIKTVEIESSNVQFPGKANKDKVYLKVGESVLEQNTDLIAVLKSGIKYSGKLQAYGEFLCIQSGSRLVMIKNEEVSHLEVIIPEGVGLSNIDLPSS